jgi:nucleotide-binding universal stress UspA family protein
MSVTAPRIVVGVDDSPRGIAALAWAVGHARATGASIEAVYAFQVPLPVPYSRFIRVPVEAVAADARMMLDHVIATQLDWNPGVRVSGTVRQGRPASVLIQAARDSDADLLVLGSSGATGIAGVLSATTGGAVIHRAPCPIVLVPHRPGTEGGRP